MDEAPNGLRERSVFPSWIRGPQDFVGGLALIAVAVFALWAASDLGGMKGFRFGPGTVPRLLALLLLGLGAVIAATGIFTEGERLAKFHWRGPLFVGLAILSFAVTIRPLGLVIAAFSSFLIAALGTPETRWGETLVVGILLTAACCGLFVYGLALPFALWPVALTQ
ncbi:tripartite tricarboxylate transporter TctB family protein [Rhodopseudomonas palustris]|uniref:Tripartite tricarboxylate transporter TctB family protein n=1 Tax=Rhodopseudomonas palustris TaxID=1076 RepID=A0A323UQT4_RHOPL|nr:tripartite tricarboxylate transporter TctB family protein [Rhodopseudomonas palustris]PZA14040.1 tripartite tricarboxylate transporter TctB family protein [Rhodopseudomonas palustris]